MKEIIYTVAGLIVGALLGHVFLSATPNLGNVTTQGVVPKVATTSLMTVGPGNASTLLPANAACTSRIITTYANAILLSFKSTLVPTGSRGHLQAASTTVNYDNAVYGCGAITAYGYTSSSSVTVTELSQ